jgi:hypothetical protein
MLPEGGTEDVCVERTARIALVMHGPLQLDAGMDRWSVLETDPRDEAFGLLAATDALLSARHRPSNVALGSKPLNGRGVTAA